MADWITELRETIRFRARRLRAKRATRAEVDVLARTIYGEARGEPVRGMEAVAAVIMNRVRLAEAWDGYWWGRTVQEVCLKPWQFSCWNPGDPNRAKIQAADRDDPAFAACLRIACRALAGVLADPTHGATHYHAKGLEPAWARTRPHCAEIGNHRFYNNVG
ncbi:MAG: cell wall hydrolase [Hyphomicrobiales bacterium]|nr:cell wall hydrolase [Hyphomicrobiales bacterium]MCP5372345.1 cell wall hydrolase [Hyphomicrobiales bacterium]